MTPKETLSATALPDELEVVAWRYRPAHVPATAPWAYMDDREPSASFTAEPLVTLSQAQSAISAMRVEIDAWKAALGCLAWVDSIQDNPKHPQVNTLVFKLETAEGEVKRLTEEKEALRKELEPFEPYLASRREGKG